ncbi:uncharacterized protein LY89DRAFT_672661 [Mollisia scopiformis]|uniref:2EXR domain-containing protein n=1 Tax=Mollisia scopiformis TaxID=149040 RepID=A0A194WZS8_MOLSC|nr:uncharacterized protein LY89DRAFT_672661 [Mollisia scopiformis]KUJ13448.1 hypothetical protein LY89DRAFT_672661 [Mollisia scopiformis]
MSDHKHMIVVVGAYRFFIKCFQRGKASLLVADLSFGFDTLVNILFFTIRISQEMAGQKEDVGASQSGPLLADDPPKRKQSKYKRYTPRKFDKFFNKLPFELRQEIWLLSLPDGQPIVVTARRVNVENAEVRETETIPSYTVPSYLMVSKEARQFSNQEKGIWIDLARDVLTIVMGEATDSFLGFKCGAVQGPTGFKHEFRVTRPLTEKIHMIAFEGSYHGVHVNFSPVLLGAMGKREKVYLVRYSGFAYDLTPTQLHVNTSWVEQVHDAIRLQYLEPTVAARTYKALRADLAELGPGVVKKRPQLEAGEVTMVDGEN